MKLEVVPSAYIHAVWPEVEKLIAPAYEYGDEYTVEQTRAFVANGTWTLIAITKGADLIGAMVVDVYNRPNDRVTYVQAIGGKDVANAETVNQLRVLSAQWGASSVECAARPSMVRLLRRAGMEPKYTVLKVSV